MRPNQNSDNQHRDSDVVSYFIMVAIAGILLLSFMPIVLSSILFGYLAYASYNYKEERKHIRTALMLISGFFITKYGWELFRSEIPALIDTQFNSKKASDLMSKPIYLYAFYGYIALSSFCFLHFHRKKASIFFYDASMQVTGWLFWPFSLLNMFSTFMLGLVIGIFSKSNNKPSGGSSRVVNVIAIFMSLAVLLIMISDKVKVGPLQSFLSCLATVFVGAYLYRIITYKEPIEKSTNLVSNMKENPLNIGRLTDPKRMDLNLSWRDLNHHIHILGQPGVGKSVLLKNIYAHQIMNGEGLLMVDLKADYKVREDFRSLCNLSNRSEDFVLIDLSHPENSYGYNPLLLGNATELKDKLIGAIEWSEQYYKKIAERTLLTVLKGFVYLRDKKGLISNLDDLLIAISSVQGVTVLAENIDDLAIRSELQAFAAGYSKDFSKDLEGLKTELTLLVRSEFGSIFKSEESLDVFSAIMDKKVILVNLDGQTYNESAKKFGRLLLADLRSASGAIVTNIPDYQRPKFTVIVDEFADIVATEDMAKTFVGFLNRCRGSGIGVVIAHQSLGDFKDETVKAQIMDSTETMFSFVQKDPDTCERLAAVVGTKETFEITKQTRDWMFGEDDTGMGTKKRVHEFIYNPNVFRNLNVGEAVYAAKKPSRYGIVQVKMLEIPHEDNVFELKNVSNRLAEARSMNLSNQLNEQRDLYKSSFKSKKLKEEEPLDI